MLESAHCDGKVCVGDTEYKEEIASSFISIVIGAVEGERHVGWGGCV